MEKSVAKKAQRILMFFNNLEFDLAIKDDADCERVSDILDVCFDKNISLTTRMPEFYNFTVKECLVYYYTDYFNDDLRARFEDEIRNK